MTDEQYQSISQQIKDACAGDYILPENGVDLVLTALFNDFVNCMDVADTITDFIGEGCGVDDILEPVPYDD